MKLVLDQGLPRTAATILTDSGHSTVHVGDIGLGEAADRAIIDYAVHERRHIVTLDTDFHAIIAVSGAQGPSAIRVRVEGLRARELASLVLGVLERCGREIESGALVSVNEHSIRLRKLPIGKDVPR